MTFLRLFLSSLILAGAGTLSAQYSFPTIFASGDSAVLDHDTKAYAAQMALHFGDIPGAVFQADHARPRISFYYQQDAAVAGDAGTFRNTDKHTLTSTGMLSLVGDVTSNLQVILRYNAMMLQGNAAELSGYGARYRSGMGTDSLHTLALGFMAQKLAGGAIAPVQTLNFSLQYGWHRVHWILQGELGLNYATGEVRRAGGHEMRYAFDHRAIHAGAGLLRSWKHVTAGIKFRTNLKIFSAMFTAGWSFPSEK